MRYLIAEEVVNVEPIPGYGIIREDGGIVAWFLNEADELNYFYPGAKAYRCSITVIKTTQFYEDDPGTDD
jgi:hypothetical protein